MKDMLEIRPVAHIHSDFSEKFGIPRQASVVKELKAEIILEKEFKKDGILRRLSGFSHIWLIWGFSENYGKKWSPTVRPPRLGGDERVGVFASRSPFRPNPLGLSAVHIESIDEKNYIIHISGADFLDGTPVYDIKPYIPYADSIDAEEGFACPPENKKLQVILSSEIRMRIPEDKLTSLIDILSCDPRPAYQNDPDRIYGFSYAGMEIHFKVEGMTLTILDTKKI